MGAIADTLKQVFAGHREEEDFYKAKKKAELESIGLSEDDMDEEVYAEGVEEDFDEDDDEDNEDDDNEEEEDNEDDEDEEENEDEDKEYEKSLNSQIDAIVSDQGALEEATVGLIKENKEQKRINQKLREEMDFLKAQHAKFLGEPALKTAPVFRKSHDDQKPSSARAKAGIMAGIQQGALSPTDMIGFEASGMLSQKARSFLQDWESK